MIRNATAADASAIAEIYAYYVENTAITFELVPPSPKEMKARINEITKAYPYLVYERNGEVIGYAYASAFRKREAYKTAVELSVYFRHDCTGYGLGKEIVTELLKRLKEMGCYYTAISGITYPNQRSEGLFRSLGFEYAGMYKNVGYKSGKWLSVMEFQYALREYDSNPKIKGNDDL